MLKGYKSYIFAGMMALWAFIAVLEGDAAGMDLLMELVKNPDMLMAGAIAALRHGMNG